MSDLLNMPDDGDAEIRPDNPLYGEKGRDGGNYDDLTDDDIERQIESVAPKPQKESLPDDIPDDIRELIEARRGGTKEEDGPPPSGENEPAPPASSSSGEAETAAMSEADIDRETLRVELERRDAALKLQQAHGSRLAGQIGYLQQELEKMKQSPSRAEMSDLDSDDVSVVERLQREVASIRESKVAEDVDRAIAEATSVLSSNPDLQGFEKSEYEALLTPYAQYWQDALASKDPATARLLASAVSANLVADAKVLRLKKQAEAIRAKKTVQVEETRNRKLASGVVKSSTPSPSKRPAKSFEELSEADQDRILDAILRQA